MNSRREFQAVTAACMLVRKEIFEEVGGFDQDFVNGFEDVDMCLKIRELGKKVIYQPQSCLYHLESQSQGRKNHDVVNAKLFVARWGHQWLVDEDLVANQNGYVIRQEISEGKFKTNLIPIHEVGDVNSWKRIVELQQLLLGHAVQSVIQMPQRQRIQELLKNAEVWPNDVGVLEWVGCVCEKLKCDQEAEGFWKKLLTICDHQIARLGLARAMLKKGMLNDAQEHVDVLKNISPDNAEVLLLEGILSMQRQNFTEAKQAFAQSLTLAGDKTKARIGFGMACLGLDRASEAWNVFEQVLVDNPDHAEAAGCLLQAGTALERWTDLASHLTRFVERNPTNCDIRFALAGVQFRAGETEKAKEHLTWLKLVQPNFEGLGDLEKLLVAEQFQSQMVSVR